MTPDSHTPDAGRPAFTPTGATPASPYAPAADAAAEQASEGTPAVTRVSTGTGSGTVPVRTSIAPQSGATRPPLAPAPAARSHTRPVVRPDAPRTTTGDSGRPAFLPTGAGAAAAPGTSATASASAPTAPPAAPATAASAPAASNATASAPTVAPAASAHGSAHAATTTSFTPKTEAPVASAAPVNPVLGSGILAGAAGAVNAALAFTKEPVDANGPRKVRASLSRIDPFSAMKMSFLLSIALGIMQVIATSVVWSVLNGMGLFAKANEMITEVFGGETKLDILQYVDFSTTLSATILVAVLNVVLLTALGALAAFLYNIISRLVGGIYVTLTDD